MVVAPRWGILKSDEWPGGRKSGSDPNFLGLQKIGSDPDLRPPGHSSDFKIPPLTACRRANHSHAGRRKPAAQAIALAGLPEILRGTVAAQALCRPRTASRNSG